MTRSQRWLLAVAGLVGSAVALWALLDAPERVTADGAVPQARTAQADAQRARRGRSALAALPPDHVQRGLDGVYQLDVALRSTTEVGGVRGEASAKLRVVLDVLTPEDAAAAKDGWLVGRLGKMEASGDATLVAQLGLNKPAAATRSFALRADPSGEVVERRFSPGMAVGERNLLTAVAAAVQVVRPEAEALCAGLQATADRWQVAESGASTTQYAEYQQRGEQTEKKWSRTRPQDGGAVPADGAVSTGSATLQWDSDALQAATLRQLVAVDLALHEAVPQRQTVQTTITLRRLGDADSAVAVTVPTALVNDADKGPTHAARLQVAPTKRAVSDVLRDSAAASAGQDWHARRTTAAELTANLKDNPQLVAELQKRLWTDDQPADALRTMLEALTATPDGSGELVIRALLTDKTAPRTARWHGMMLMLTLHKPHVATLQALQIVAERTDDDLSGPAALALAAQVHRCLERKNLADDSLRKYLLHKAELTFAADRQIQPGADAHASGLQASSDARVWLSVMGNLGGEQVFGMVSPYLVDQREGMRKAAINALRFVPTNPARIALLKALQKDPSPYARRAAAETALYHPQKYMEEAVVRALQEDAHPEVQMGASWTLAVWAVTAPGLYAEIDAAAKRATNPNLKQILGQLAVGSVSDQQAEAAKAAAAKAEAEETP